MFTIIAMNFVQGQSKTALKMQHVIKKNLLAERKFFYSYFYRSLSKLQNEQKTTLSTLQQFDQNTCFHAFHFLLQIHSNKIIDQNIAGRIQEHTPKIPSPKSSLSKF